MYQILVQTLSEEQKSRLVSNPQIEITEGNEISITSKDLDIVDTLDEMAIKYKIIGQESLVGIFEFHKNTMGWPEKTSKGLARITCIDNAVFVDISLNKLDQGHYELTVNEFGDLRDSPASLGNALINFGIFSVGKDGVLKSRRRYSELGLGFKLQSGTALIGRSIMLRCGDDAVIGILARSAGVYENTKRICSCTGRTIWEE